MRMTLYLDDMRDAISEVADEEDDRELNGQIHEIMDLYVGRKESIEVEIDTEAKTITIVKPTDDGEDPAY